VSVVVVTGSAGLIGSAASEHLAALGADVVGIDNDMRREFFGEGASTQANLRRMRAALGGSYRHHDIDIRDREGVDRLFKDLGTNVGAVIHAAAQPSHDWAARAPFVDFDINAVGTLNVLEATRLHSPDAVFIFTSTNKVYGDTPNRLPLVELETRWEIEPGHRYEDGIREDMSVDSTLHSLFGASKLAADVLVQEYGRYFGLSTACFRGGTLSGTAHAATELHGFLAYVIRCAMSGTTYTVYGYRGKQVRDVIDSRDVVKAFELFIESPRRGEVYNLGGGRHSHVSVLEAIDLAQRVTGRELDWKYEDRNRIGDHVWWISSNSRFEQHFPDWRIEHTVETIAEDIYEANRERWADARAR
jgi:CDP-paratose 2-epimerase